MLLNIHRESSMPECGSMSQSKEDTFHTWLSGVNRSDHRWVVRHHFGNACGLLGDVMSQGFTVIQVVMQVLGDLDSVLVGMRQPQLEGAEQASQAWDCWPHESKLP